MEISDTNKLSVNQMHKRFGCPKQAFKEWYDILLEKFKRENKGKDKGFREYVADMYKTGEIEAGEEIKSDILLQGVGRADNKTEIEMINATGNSNKNVKTYMGIDKRTWMGLGLIFLFTAGVFIYRKNVKA